MPVVVICPNFQLTLAVSCDAESFLFLRLTGRDRALLGPSPAQTIAVDSHTADPPYHVHHGRPGPESICRTAVG